MLANYPLICPASCLHVFACYQVWEKPEARSQQNNMLVLGVFRLSLAWKSLHPKSRFYLRSTKVRQGAMVS
jgi:hypothetical protein